ncbi:MFS transporter [Streptomyces radicis]|uniref:MFS transporter n=1 Tax=Streptomyces radicis TaxID=1750517 RepID=A0A3A9WXU2_9ACTN|nr:MFS transporter [Streptomyces radicis]RKN12626.1 MFS transporter [Streptomyces radicis]RKN27610.1 MFS transporter [Streptomyces radicis]
MPHPDSLAPSSDATRRARLAVGAVFAVHGAAQGSFATRIPWIKEHLDLSTAVLGLALAFPAIGASLAMPLASRIMHRYGALAAVRALLMLWCAALALPAVAPSLVALCAVFAVFGATAGMADVVMNAQGVDVERAHGRSIMSGLHGLWSVGTLLGAAVGVGAVHLGVDARAHLALVAATLVAATPFICRGLLDVRPKPDEDPPPRFALPPRSALLIGAVGMCAILAEGASADWSGVYLREVTGASETVAAASYTAFACTMAAARLAGDAVVRRVGPVRAVRLSGALAVSGGTLVVTAQAPAQGIAGFALLGVGVAVVVPLAFAAAGRSGPNPSQAIAGVATVTYTTGLFAPTLIGTIGEVTSLPVSFGVVTAATAVLVAAAGVLGAGGRSATVASDLSAPGGARAAGDAGGRLARE